MEVVSGGRVEKRVVLRERVVFGGSRVTGSMSSVSLGSSSGERSGNSTGDARLQNSRKTRHK